MLLRAPGRALSRFDVTVAYILTFEGVHPGLIIQAAFLPLGDLHGRVIPAAAAVLAMFAHAVSDHLIELGIGLLLER